MVTFDAFDPLLSPFSLYIFKTMSKKYIFVLFLSSYLFGISVQANEEKIIRMPVPGPVPESNKIADLEKQVAAGDRKAQFNLASAYLNGRGVSVDKAKAIELFRQSAQQGYSYAQFNLGEALRTGTGVNTDAKEARIWFRKAADQGLAVAQAYVGMAFEIGDGCEIDLKQAQDWYEKSAAQGNDLGETYLANLFSKQKSDTAAQAKAVILYQRAADQSNSEAQGSLGRLYLHGLGVEKNLQKAKSLLESASQGGEMLALANLAIMYEKGYGVPLDHVLAYTYLFIAKINSDSARLTSKLLVDLDKIEPKLTAAQRQATQLRAKSWRVGQALPTRSEIVE